MPRNLRDAKLLMSEVSRKALRKVDNSQRRHVEQALIRFAENPLDPNLHFERYRGFGNLYSIRATLSLRIFLADDGDMQMQIVHIGNHDYVKRIRYGAPARHIHGGQDAQLHESRRPRNAEARSLDQRSRCRPPIAPAVEAMNAPISIEKKR